MRGFSDGFNTLTLSPIIMVLENYPKWKETIIGDTPIFHWTMIIGGRVTRQNLSPHAKFKGTLRLRDDSKNWPSQHMVLKASLQPKMILEFQIQYFIEFSDCCVGFGGFSDVFFSFVWWKKLGISLVDVFSSAWVSGELLFFFRKLNYPKDLGPSNGRVWTCIAGVGSSK